MRLGWSEIADFAREPRERGLPVAVSAALHGALILVLGFSVAPTPVVTVAETVVRVVTATSRQFESALHPEPPARPVETPPTPLQSAPSPPSSAPATSEPAPGPRPWRRGTRMLSASALDDPKNKSVSPKLAHVEPNTALEQICDLEAILQIGRIEADFVPDSVVAYAMGETRISREFIVADGAAFRSRGRWYNLKFRCRISERERRVLAFEFEVGDAVPRVDWSAHALAAGSFETGEE